MGKASTRAHNKYNAKAYDRINLTVAKGQKDSIQAHAAAAGESVNGFIGRAISEAMARDGPGGHSGAAGGPPGGGAVSLPSEVLRAAQEAAEAAREALPEFVTRAVSETAERDRLSRDS